jgi:outer membrane protein OmpA-like peptidoglycan-associated protein
MTTNLLDLARAQLTPEVIQRASSLVGETPASTQRAMEAAAPTIFAGIVQEGSSVSGAGHLLRILEETGLSGTMAGIAERKEAESGALDSLVTTGKELFGRLFGGRVGSLVDATAASSGVKHSSMSSLLGLTTPLVLGALGSEVATRHLDAAGLSRLLAEQKSTVARMLPSGAAAALGLSGVSTREPVDSRAVVVKPAPARFPWILLLAIPLALLVGFALRNRSTPRVQERVPDVVVAPPVVRAPPTVTIPTPLVGQGTASQQLALFLAAPDGQVPKRFVLDNLNFDTATAQLVPAAATTLDSVTAVLKAHPTAQIVLEGHTDNVGDPASNRVLSQNRADAVKAALVARGIAADRIMTAGLGQQQPITTNDTEEGRAQNRRTEIVVTRR